MPDSNDIIFNEYSLDFFGFIDLIFSFLFGIGNGGAAGGGNGFGGNGGVLSNWSPGAVFEWLSNTWSVLVILSWLVSALLIFGIIYAYIRHGHLNEVFAEILKRQEEAYKKIHSKEVKNQRWEDVLVHVDGDKPSDWKLAIIEADIVLDDMLNSLGYVGNTIGEKLKTASPNNFRTINQAWHAHNVRNRIAHEGADFELSQSEARQVVTEYKMVFEEFDFI